MRPLLRSLGMLTILFALVERGSAQGEAGSIDGITPAAARHGGTVTIDGKGFGAKNVQITVAGIAAQVLTATGNQATFLVPAAAPAGATVVTATNPGGHSGSIAFRVLEGILLTGTGPALAATSDMPPVGVDHSLIQNGVFLTRIDVTFAPGATVDQINQALAKVQGGIVSMSKGSPFVTIGVPQGTPAALEGVAQILRSSPGILWAFVGRAPKPDVLPIDPSSFQDKHLLPTRFPAAWNAGLLAFRNCGTQPKLPVLVADEFSDSALPPAYIGFPAQVPGFHVTPPPPPPPVVETTETHGFDVTTTLAALFDTHTPTGANPFTQCLDVVGVQIGGVTLLEALDRMATPFRRGISS